MTELMLLPICSLITLSLFTSLARSSGSPAGWSLGPCLPSSCTLTDPDCLPGEGELSRVSALAAPVPLSRKGSQARTCLGSLRGASVVDTCTVWTCWLYHSDESVAQNRYLDGA